MVALNLIYRAYECIEDGDLRYAADILESLVGTDPLNIEAWEAYMQICATTEDLDRLCERILQITDINWTDRESILDYYYFLRERIMSSEVQYSDPKMITFELVDQFTYTLKDQYENIVSDGDTVNVEKGIAWFLGKVIFVPYVLLFAIGLKLVFAGRNFGHWFLMILALGVLVGVWKVVVHLIEHSHKPAGKQSKKPGTQSHSVPRRSELIP